MSILTRAADLLYTFRFLKLLVTPFDKTEAFKLGIIDKDGKRDKDMLIDTPEKKAAYTAFQKLVFNIKKLMAKAPGGGSRIASYAAALYLLKDNYNISDKEMDLILEEMNLDKLDFIKEDVDWFVVEDNELSPGTYRIKNESIIINNFNDVVKAKDKILVKEDNKPVGDIFGLDVYKVIHRPTNQEMYVTSSELYK
tara:strand:- start:16934 stop:17521 length:588 start_codon:yes stop_codon:yes gene_type:complete